jgi:hypothetical protein
MTIEKAIELLDKAWAESLERFGAGSSDEANAGTDVQQEVDGGSDLEQALKLLDCAWGKSINRFNEDGEIKRHRALFPLYLLGQVHKHQPVDSEQWRIWLEQVRSDLDVSSDFPSLLVDETVDETEIDKFMNDYASVSNEITGYLLKGNGEKHADC